MSVLRCHGTKADGRPCGAPPSLVDSVTGFCRSHGPGARERLSEQGRLGAAVTARKLQGEGLDPKVLPTLDGPRAAALWIDVVARAVATGRLGHREATAVVRSIEVFLRANDAGAVTEEIAELRAALAEWKNSGDARALLEVVR